ncbi:MAG: pyridoxamine 5'-phosphate oxidase family protein [Spirochaetaceae bacterium]|nr:pyridoxamine 5'-phosphate oxidase family protein [Spirochaetaceae bacterium]
MSTLTASFAPVSGRAAAPQRESANPEHKPANPEPTIDGNTYAPTERSRVRRVAKRAVYDRYTVHAIIDAALVCHVGFVVEGWPRVLPTAIARVGECVYVHGNRNSAMLQTLATGAPACITVTHLDGLVVARSVFHSSMNYRCVVIHATGHAVTGARKRVALDALVERLIPGRTGDVRAPTAKELAVTSVLEFPLEEVSAKVRTGPPADDKDDYLLPFWGGVVPLRMVAGAPESDDASLRARIAPPPYLVAEHPGPSRAGSRPRAGSEPRSGIRTRFRLRARRNSSVRAR